MQKLSTQPNDAIVYRNTIFARAKRWLYRGNRPHWIAKAFIRLDALVGTLGLTGNFLVTLEVVGRKSGRAIAFPLVVAVIAGERYLVSMLGNNAQWVQNVRAAGGRAVLYSGRRQEVGLEEVPINQRAPILKAYLQRAPGARPHIPIDKNAPLATFEQIAADFPVFHVKLL